MLNSDFSAGKTRFFFRKSSLCSGSLFESTQKCTELGLNLLYILVLGTYSKFTRKINFKRPAFAFRRPARALAAGLPRQDHIYRITVESFRFHNNKFDEMCRKLDSTENLRSFETYPTPPENPKKERESYTILLEQRCPSVYTPRGFTSSSEREAR